MSGQRQRYIVQKADISVANLRAEGGLMTPMQQSTFVDMLMLEPTILNQARRVNMPTTEYTINSMGFKDRILRAGPAAGTTLRAEDRARPDFSQVKLNAVTLMAEIHIPYDVLEENIEGQSLEGRIMRQATSRLAVDLEELFITGDTTHTIEVLAQTDGILKMADEHIVDQNNADIDRPMFRNAMIAMPDEYLRLRGQMRHYISNDQETMYRDVVAERLTGLGDQMAVTNAPVFAFGVPVEAASMLPYDQGFFTFPKNLIFGVYRDVLIETDKDIRAQELIIVVSMRVAMQIDDREALVKYINIKQP